MSQSQIMKTAFFVSTALTLVGATFKILHLPGGGAVILFALISTAIWTILAIIEVWSSRRLDFTEN
jgi:hypothetical protein